MCYNDIHTMKPHPLLSEATPIVPAACGAGHLEGHAGSAAAQPAGGGQAHGAWLHAGPGCRPVCGAGCDEGPLLQGCPDPHPQRGRPAEVSIALLPREIWALIRVP